MPDTFAQALHGSMANAAQMQQMAEVIRIQNAQDQAMRAQEAQNRRAQESLSALREYYGKHPDATSADPLRAASHAAEAGRHVFMQTGDPAYLQQGLGHLYTVGTKYAEMEKDYETKMAHILQQYQQAGWSHEDAVAKLQQVLLLGAGKNRIAEERGGGGGGGGDKPAHLQKWWAEETAKQVAAQAGLDLNNPADRAKAYAYTQQLANDLQQGMNPEEAHQKAFQFAGLTMKQETPTNWGGILGGAAGGGGTLWGIGKVLPKLGPLGKAITFGAGAFGGYNIPGLFGGNQPPAGQPVLPGMQPPPQAPMPYGPNSFLDAAGIGAPAGQDYGERPQPEY